MILSIAIISLESIKAVLPVMETQCRHADAIILFRKLSDFKWSIPGVNEISKNLDVISKLQEPEGWRKARAVLRTDKYWMPRGDLASETCELLVNTFTLIDTMQDNFLSICIPS
jgi:hypothetical protein